MAARIWRDTMPAPPATPHMKPAHENVKHQWMWGSRILLEPSRLPPLLPDSATWILHGTSCPAVALRKATFPRAARPELHRPEMAVLMNRMLAERTSSHTTAGGRRRLTYRGRALPAGTLRAVSGRTGSVGSGTRLRVDHVTGFIIRPEDCRRGPSPHSLCALPRMLQKRTLASEDVTKSHWSAAHPSQARAILGACRQIFAAPTHGAAQRHYADVAPATPGTRSDVTKLHPGRPYVN